MQKESKMSIPRGFIEVNGTRINIDHISSYNTHATYKDKTCIFINGSDDEGCLVLDCTVEEIDDKIIDMIDYMDGFDDNSDLEYEEDDSSNVAGPH
jgi:hypothetical protein